MKAAIVVADKDAIATKLIEHALLDMAIFRAGKEKCTPAVNAPVASQKRLARLHERAQRMAERKVAEADPRHWRPLCAMHLHKVL